VGRFATPPGQRVQKFVQKFGNIVYAGGATPSVNIPQSDYLFALDIISNQTVTCGATSPVVAAYGAYGPLGTVTIATNGARHPFALPGYLANIYEKIRRGPRMHDDLVAAPITANGVGLAWRNSLHIPLTVADGTERGCWYTGDNALQMYLRLQCNAAATVFSTVNGATIQGSWDIYRTTFNAPRPDAPGGWLEQITWYHEVQLQTTQQLSNGTTTLVLPNNTDYERIILVFYTGSDQDATFAPADGLYTAIDLVINDKIHIVESVGEWFMRETMDQLYGQNVGSPTPGVAVIDFLPEPNSRRDVLPTDTAAAQTVKLNITSTSASNFVDVITETVTDSPFAARWVAAAAATAGAAKAA
jgi:hypothetical protein